MKKKFIVAIILTAAIFLLCGCNEKENVGINYNDMEKFAGFWFNQSRIDPEYFLITEDGKIFALNKEQGELLKNDYDNFSEIVLNWDNYEKYRFVDDYFELFNFTSGEFFRYATYNFQDGYNLFIFNIINGGEIIYERVNIAK